MWVCERYVVHHLSSTGLRCATSLCNTSTVQDYVVKHRASYIVHHWPACVVHHTLISVTGSGHIKYKKRRLPCKIKGQSSCQSYLLRYMAAGHIFYKLKTWNTKEIQTYKMNGEWPFILYAEHIFQIVTFNFIWPLLQAPLHAEIAFIKYEKWSYKSQKRDSSFILNGHSLSHYSECMVNKGGLFISSRSKWLLV